MLACVPPTGHHTVGLVTACQKGYYVKHPRGNPACCASYPCSIPTLPRYISRFKIHPIIGLLFVHSPVRSEPSSHLANHAAPNMILTIDISPDRASCCVHAAPLDCLHSHSDMSVGLKHHTPSGTCPVTVCLSFTMWASLLDRGAAVTVL